MGRTRGGRRLRRRRSELDADRLPSLHRGYVGAALFGASGSSAFGLLGAATGIDTSTVTTSASQLVYSPDGLHWSSVALDQALHFDANIPSIAVGGHNAILESGLHTPGAQPQRFWLVTVRL